MADNTPKPIELLYEAALRGDESLLQDLLLRDPFLLHRPLPASSITPLLHVACKLGRAVFVLKILHRNPNLAEEVNPNDKSSLLHLAAKISNGQIDLVKFLVSVNPDLCYARDMHGRTPVHVAAIKGQVDVLEELLRSTPAAARERVGSSLETVMHLCVKFNQLEALMRTVRMVGDAQMLNATDFEGNTILHVAVANKHLQIVEFLLRDRRLKKNSLNSNGLTAMDIFDEIPKDVNNNVDARLRSALQREKVFTSKRAIKELAKEKYSKWIEKQRSTLMIVASLIATMAFQAGLNPPGGVWQDNDGHTAGTSIMAQENPGTYDWFFKWNTAGFVLSMASVLLLISGLPFKRFFMVLIRVTMWVAVAFMAITYGFSSYKLLPPNYYLETKDNVIGIFTISWIGLMALLLLGHIIQWPVKFIKYLRNRK